MPAPIPTTGSKSNPAEAQTSSSAWYESFPGKVNRGKTLPADDSPAGDRRAAQDPLDTLTLMDIPGPHNRTAGRVAAADTAPPEALVEALAHLAQSNKQLSDRIDSLLRAQERDYIADQNIRAQLQDVGDRLDALASFDAAAVRRETRVAVTEEIRPVLLAILEVLKRTTTEPAAEPAAAPAPITPPEQFDAAPLDDYGKLPAILTCPLDELMAEAQVGDGRAHRRARRGLRRRGAPAPRRTANDMAGGLGPFTSTTVFSS